MNERCLCLVLAMLVGVGWANRIAHAGDNAGAETIRTERADFSRVALDVFPKIVKIFGAGGLRGLEANQSGILVTGDGHVLTMLSYVLDTDEMAVVLDDGRRYSASLVGADPLTEIAVLKLETDATDLPHFRLEERVTADVGTRVLAFSNLFAIATADESVSVLHGSISGVAPLAARRGAYSTRFHGEVYVVDAITNNPGSAGGALTDSQGRLLGLIGKEVHSELTGTWLNFAIPVASLAPVVDDIIAGRFQAAPLDELDRPEVPLKPAALGVVLVPDVLPRTPPYIDRVLPGSPAEKAGLLPDDLVVMIDGQVTNSCRDVADLLGRNEHDAQVTLTILRGEELLEFPLGGAAK
jgi:serine protease Do